MRKIKKVKGTEVEHKVSVNSIKPEALQLPRWLCRLGILGGEEEGFPFVLLWLTLSLPLRGFLGGNFWVFLKRYQLRASAGRP